MPYSINLTNGDLLSVVEDGTVDVTASSVALVGKNFAGYGEYLNENFIHLLENFSGGSAPPGPLIGQLWFDSVNSELKVWKGQTWTSTGKPTIVNDTTSTGSHYLTFVNTSSGTPDIKVSATRGLIYTPGSGNFGIGVSTANSRLVVSNNATITVAAAAPVTDVVVHLHGADGKSPKLLVDAYGGSAASGNYSVDNSSKIVLRRSNGSSSTPEAIRINDVVGSIGIQGYSASSYITDRAAINFVATENWALGANGTRVAIVATATGSGVPTTVATFGGNGSLEITGAFRAGGDITAFFTSDENLKTNIKTIDNALNKVISLDGITFNWNNLAVDKDQTVREAGLKAQQVHKVLPEVVATRPDGFMAVNYEKLVPLLVEAIKELKAEIDQLKKSV